MTGRELLGFLAALWELPHRAAVARIGEVTDRLGLGGVMDRRIATYSGGTRRRLDLAGALLHRPRVLFLDEPTTGLDPQSRRALWEQVRELRDQGSAIFLTTQYLEEAAQLADRIAVLHAGRLAAEDTPDGLRRRHGGLRLRVRVDQHPPAPAGWAGNGQRPDRHGWITRPVGSAAQAHRLLDGLVADGAAVAEFHLDEPTLEDAYLALTGTEASPAPPAAVAAVPA
jgi:ABC-type multidrug transport system ATPase subunit